MLCSALKGACWKQTNSRNRAVLRKYPPLRVMVFTMNASVAGTEIVGKRRS
jgi:hypothetical protein